MTDLPDDFEDVMFARMEGKPDNWRPDGWGSSAIPTFLDRGEVHIRLDDWIRRLQDAQQDADLVLGLPRRKQKERVPGLQTARSYWRLRYIRHGIERAIARDSQYLVGLWNVNATWLALFEEIHSMARAIKGQTPYR